MQHSKIRSRLKAQLTKFTSQLTVGLSKPLRNFVGEMLFGIQASQDLKLSSVARSLGEDIPLIKTEDRLSRNLQAEELEAHLRTGLLRLGSRRVESNTVLCLDLSDVRKEYARKMEFLDQVWDGSAGEVHAGYWLCSVIGAEVQGSELTPRHLGHGPRRRPEKAPGAAVGRGRGLRARTPLAADQPVRSAGLAIAMVDRTNLPDALEN